MTIEATWFEGEPMAIDLDLLKQARNIVFDAAD